MSSTARPLLIAMTLALLSAAAMGQEATIRKALTERLPQLPKIDEISRTPVPGLWEVRYGGTELLYSDDKGEYIFVNGSMVETKTRTDLTEARLEKMLAVDWDKLPLKDAVAIRQGTGARKMAVFVDPNCGYCKRFERDLAGIKDVTIYTFLIPILGPDSTVKTRDIWCSKDAAKVWRSWMLDGVSPPKAMANCDTGNVDRNLAFARTYRINGTPAVFFEDGTRKPGAIPADLVEKLLVAAAKK
jgi:thiol:disulfide interchange protein DsbC